MPVDPAVRSAFEPRDLWAAARDLQPVRRRLVAPQGGTTRFQSRKKAEYMTTTVQPAPRSDDSPTGHIPTQARVAGTPATRMARYIAGALRISLGWVFLWAFLDKAFALGHDTGLDPQTGAIDYFGAAAWIHGGSPTAGFLGFATKGPLAGVYQDLAGNAVIDWLFMLALLGIGVALILGIGMRIAAVSGAALLVLMWSAVLPPANNLFMDDHIVYALVLVLLALLGAGRTWGLGTRWEHLPVVRDHAVLQ
jgi:thiosulfate dehydrogenase [quinone] large subunit